MNKFIIGTVKGLDYIYGIDILLKACAAMKEERPELEFQIIIAGKGRDESSLRALADKLGLDILWLGFIPQEQVAYEWANMDIAVISSRKESFGVSAIEAQACGTPVIVSDVPGLLETTVVDGNVFMNGDSVSLKNTILRIYDDRDKAKSMAVLGRENAIKKYELNDCFTHIEKLFEKYSRNPD